MCCKQLVRVKVSSCLLQHHVVAVSGEAGRKAFFNDKDLNFTEGYKVLLGTAPDLEDIKLDIGEEKERNSFPRFVLDLSRTERIVDCMSPSSLLPFALTFMMCNARSISLRD